MKRIDFLASLTKGYQKIIDIGTDHGLVLKKAFDQGYIKSAIATDINPLPLNSARINLSGYPVHFVVTDGFKNLNDDFELAIIAGMGSYTIIDILEDAPTNKTYILQSNDKVEILRSYLTKHNFKISDEWIIFDKFYYVIIKAESGNEILTEEDIFLGPILKTKPERINYYQSMIKRLELILKSCDDETKVVILKKINWLKENIYR